MTRLQWKRLCDPLHRPLRRVTGTAAPPLPGANRASNAEVRCSLRRAPVELVFASKILMYAPRLASGPGFLHALVQSEGGQAWRQRLVQAMTVLQLIVKPKFDSLPSPAEQPGEWEAFWSRWPGQWRSACKLMLRIAGEDPERASSALVHTGVKIAEAAADGDDAEWLCVECGRDFPSLNSLAAHKMWVHEWRDPLRAKIANATCPACEKSFFLRDRLLHHLRASQACSLVLAAMPDLPTEQVRALDAEARDAIRANQRAGRHRMAGPVARRTAV